MSSLDNSADYKKAQSKVKALQSNNDLKGQYSKAKKQTKPKVKQTHEQHQ